MKRFRWLWIAGTSVLCAAVLCLALSKQILFTDAPSTQTVRPTIVIDAGHGEFDGGAVAPDGTQEKDINLAIAKSLASMLTVCGFDVVMTRQTDEGLHNKSDGTIREKKVSDMNARLALYEQGQMTVSIHQNMFAAVGCHGTQVFYSANHPFSKVLATHVREEIVRQLQPDNTRELKAGNRDIFLLHKASKPAVLVECGFLSNADELTKLKSEEYQRQLAFAIACGVMQYTIKAL